MLEVMPAAISKKIMLSFLLELAALFFWQKYHASTFSMHQIIMLA
jgi:hypothetical protein